jgi:hypothetical protein
MPENDNARLGGAGAIDTNQDPGDGISATQSLIPAADIASADVVIVTSYGHPRRRVFLSLHAATEAAKRAKAKGRDVQLVLCKLEPVAADLDLGGEWSS